ncbi:MAG: histidine kinase [Ponticaulis sp.]|nr:histidine kinase [Ponticaulis sp.]
MNETKPDRSFFYSSGRSSNEAGFLFQLIARLYGTNNVNNCSYYCHQATGVALGSTIGTGTSTVELEDLSLCDTIFVIGANPSSNHPRFIHKLKACRDRGGQVIIINPAKEPGLVKFALPKSPKSLLSGGSEIASEYLQPKIGEDLALFKGIAKALIEGSQLDDAFIEAHTTGFDAYLETITAISWDQIADRCGISRQEIERIAALYASSDNAVFAWGMGMTHHLNGVENIEEIAALAFLRGMIGRPGAGLLPLRGHSNVQGVGTIGVKPVLASDVIARMEEVFGISLPETRGMDTMACMKAADAGEIDAAVIMGGNLYAANPNSSWAKAALDKIGFKLFLTTTLNQGHVNGVESGDVVILPVTARDEEWEPTTQESMFNFVRLSDGGICRLETVRPESVILADLAARILSDCPIDFSTFARHDSLREAISRTVPGMEDLADISKAKHEFHIRNRLLHTPTFQTPDGKAVFPENMLTSGQADKNYPFVMATIRSEGQFNSIIYEERDSYRGTEHRWTVLMNRKDMDVLGLNPGDKVDLSSENGDMTGVEVHAFDVPQGCVMTYYPEANALTGNKVDPRSHTPAFKSVKVQISATEKY